MNFNKIQYIALNMIGSYSGAGQEVGRSCIMLEFKGKTIMVTIMFINYSLKSTIIFVYKCKCSLTAASIRACREWTHCLSLI